MPTKKKRDISWEQIGEAIGRKVEKEEGRKPWMFHKHRHSSGGAVYGLGFLGALFYYLTTAASFWDAVVGVVKAVLWPAFLTYGIFKFLGM